MQGVNDASFNDSIKECRCVWLGCDPVVRAVSTQAHPATAETRGRQGAGPTERWAVTGDCSRPRGRVGTAHFLLGSWTLHLS